MCSRVAPVGFAPTDHFGSGPIGVGYTGSPESREALRWAESLARQLGSGLRLITAIREFNPAHLLGGVSGRILRTAPCPAVVTPRSIQREPGDGEHQA